MTIANNATTTYTLNYDAAGGESAPAATSVAGNENYALFRVDTATPSRPGFSFAGWSFTPGGPAEVFAGDLFTATSIGTTLYAVWSEEVANVPVIDEVETENAEPLGVVAVSNNTQTGLPLGVVLGFSFICFALAASAAVLLIRARRPRIVTKEYE